MKQRLRLVDKNTWERDPRVKIYDVEATCTVCGGPRGPITEKTWEDQANNVIHIYDDWQNPCGHREMHADVLANVKKSFSQMSIREIFTTLAEQSPGMVIREGQIGLSEAVQQTLDSDLEAMIEAGTGVGKSKGYLVPIVLSGKRATIATASKGLQDQIFYKDLQEVMGDLGIKRNAVLLKGANNYLCKHNINTMSTINEEYAKESKELFAWMDTPEGKKGDINDYTKETVMNKGSITVDREICNPKKCKFSDRCPWVDLKESAKVADILVTNQHLLFLSNEAREDRFLVVDEAHELPGVAMNVLGMDINLGKAQRDVSNLYQYNDVLLESVGLNKDLLGGILANIDLLAMRISADSKKESEDMPLVMGFFQDTHFVLDVEKMNSYIEKSPMENLSKRMKTLIYFKQVLDVIQSGRKDLIYYVSKSNGGISVKITFKDIAPLLKQYLWDNPKVKGGAVLSATLRYGGFFDYSLRKLGMGNTTPTMLFESPFDYQVQSRLYIPADDQFVDPSGPLHRRWRSSQIFRLITAMKGRTLVLFTSNKALTEVYEDMRDHIPYTIFKQGDMPINQLREAFMADVNSVLFATKTFWTGIDVPGEALSCTIMDKLPFPQIGSPFTKGISDTKVNSLSQFMVPEAAITMAQGAGRLIRRETDRGIIAVLDQRIVTASYAKKILATMPNAPIIRSIEEVKEFMDN